MYFADKPRPVVVWSYRLVQCPSLMRTTAPSQTAQTPSPTCPALDRGGTIPRSRKKSGKGSKTYPESQE